MLDECRSVDRYEKLNRINEGTYGVVYRYSSCSVVKRVRNSGFCWLCVWLGPVGCFATCCSWKMGDAFAVAPRARE